MTSFAQLYRSTFETPAGSFTVAVDEDGFVVGAYFGGWSALVAALGSPPSIEDEERTAEVRGQVLEYWRGERREFDLELAPPGTAFQRRVWEALRRIPFGETRNYGELARELKSAARAVGGANGANRCCLLIPCHRVIAADGRLHGFSAGLELKRRLLEHEGAL